MRRKTHEEFLGQVFSLVGEEYSVLEKYSSGKKKLLFRHNVCGQEYKVTPGNFIIGHRCPRCSRNIKKTHEEFVIEVKSVVGDEYSVLGQYKNAGTKILMQHNKCGTIYGVTPCHFLNSSTRCPACFGRNIKISNIEFVNRINKIFNNEYAVIGGYVNNRSKVTVKHIPCGLEFEARADHLMAGHGCPKCKGTPKKTHEEFVSIVEQLTGNEYRVLSEYNGRTEKIKMKHEKCGHVFNTAARGFLEGNRCPRCKESKGEFKIRTTLKSREIRFVEQYRDKNCRDVRPLPFDFAILNKNNLAACLIEYQGKQHYKLIEYFGGHKHFINRQNKDQIKRDFCQQNNIPLIEIPYTIKDIESYLSKQLQEIGLSTHS